MPDDFEWFMDAQQRIDDLSVTDTSDKAVQGALAPIQPVLDRLAANDYWSGSQPSRDDDLAAIRATFAEDIRRFATLRARIEQDAAVVEAVDYLKGASETDNCFMVDECKRTICAYDCPIGTVLRALAAREAGK